MRVHCDGCHAPIPAADVDLRAGLAKCPACHQVFRLPEASSDAPVPPRAGAPDLRASEIVPIPETLGIIEEDGVRAIARRWRSPAHTFAAVFCVAWFGMLSTMLPGGSASAWGALEYVLLAPFAAAGGVMAYWSLAGFVNRSWVRVADGVLEVRHEPLPWPGNRRIALAELDQLYAEERTVHRNDGEVVTYSLSALLKNGRRVVIFPGIGDADDAAFAAHRINGWLGIHPRPVVGQVGR